MGKKSAPKVEDAVPPSNSVKNGKREAEDELETQVSPKKQKGDEVAEKQKEEAEVRENKNEINSDESSLDYEQNEAPKSEVPPSGDKNGPAAMKNTVQSSQRSPDSSSESDSDRSFDEGNVNAAPDVQKSDLKTVEKNTSSDSSEDDDDYSKKPQMVKTPVKDSESSEDSKEDIEKNSSKTPQEIVKDVEMVDAASIGNKASKTPTNPKQGKAGSRTIYVRNLSYSVERGDLETLFKDCGEIVDIRLHIDNEGRFRGFGHVEFATAEAAQKVIYRKAILYISAYKVLSNKALVFHNIELLRCRIIVGIARQKGEYTPYSSYLSNSFQKDEGVQSQTVYVRGFDRSLSEEQLKASLEELFSSCGEITRISIPKYHDSGALKGFAHLDFKDVDGFKKALQLPETKLGGYPLSVEKAKPRRDYIGAGSDRWGGGHQFGGRGGGGHGDRGGWREKWQR